MGLTYYGLLCSKEISYEATRLVLINSMPRFKHSIGITIEVK